MAPVSKPLVIAALLASVLAVLYATRLGVVPAYLIHDEVRFSVQAQSIAASARDTNGRLLPVYFSDRDLPAGIDPVIIYLTALTLRVLPLSEVSVRLPTALIGVASSVLMFLLARRLFASDAMGLIAAGMLALTPAHFMHSRLALSIVYPVPFIIGWLIGLRRFDERGEARALVAAFVVLGLGIYSYLGYMVMLPIYVLLSGLVIARRKASWSLVAPGLIGFAVTLVPLLLWQVAHPTRFADLITTYHLQSGQATTGAPGGFGLLSYEAIRLRIALYWNFFSQAFLFVSGDSSLINSTRQIGFFPMSCAVLIPVGIYHIVRHRSTMGLVVLLGFVTAPVAGVISGDLELNRLLFVLPFAALTATYGVSGMLASMRPTIRWAACALLLTIPWQFWGFYRDYTGPYWARASTWFGGNLRGALQEVLSRTPEPPAIYLSSRIPYGDIYGQFYALSAGRPDLVGRAVYVEPDGDEASRTPAGAVMVTPAGAAAGAAWERLQTVAEPNGAPSFVIYERR